MFSGASFSIRKSALGIYLFVSFFFIFFCGSFSIGAITLRNLSVITLLLFSFYRGFNIQKMDVVTKSFIVYLVVCVIINILNGCFFSESFVRMMLVFQFPSLVIVLSLPVLLKEKGDIDMFVIILFSLSIVDSIVSIGQFFEVDFFWNLSKLLSVESPDLKDTLILGSYLPGLTGNVVENGYFVTTLLPVVCFGFWSQNNLKIFVCFLAFLVSAYSIFLIQQRTAFLLLLFWIIYLILVKKNRLLISVFVLIVIFSYIVDFSFELPDMGRLSVETENDDRYLMLNQFYSFLISSDVILGGYDIYLNNYGNIVQHNAFTSALVIGGVFVFIFFIALIVSLLKLLFSCYVKFEILRPLCMGCIIYFLYSMTHSSGIQNGAPLFWTLYGVIVSSLIVDYGLPTSVKK